MLLQFLQQGKRGLEDWTLERNASLCISLVKASHVIKGQLGCPVIKSSCCGGHQCRTASLLFPWVGRGSQRSSFQEVSAEICPCSDPWPACTLEVSLIYYHLSQLCKWLHISFEIRVCWSVGALANTSFEHAVMDLFMFCLSHLNEGLGDPVLHLSSSWEGPLGGLPGSVEQM